MGDGESSCERQWCCWRTQSLDILDGGVCSPETLVGGVCSLDSARDRCGSEYDLAAGLATPPLWRGGDVSLKHERVRCMQVHETSIIFREQKKNLNMYVCMVGDAPTKHNHSRAASNKHVLTLVRLIPDQRRN